MNKPIISVIIPTYNRSTKLLRTLQSAEQQTFNHKHFEIIIIDDGSNDSTAIDVKKFITDSNLSIKYLHQKNTGPAKARNTGIRAAQGSIILFCGDDTLMHTDFLATHYAAHTAQAGIAVLGLTLWDESTQPASDFMNYIAPAGPQFHYNLIKNNKDVNCFFFYTSNISLERKWLTMENFDESFPYAAFEDIELGLRLKLLGLKITYQRNAIVYHSHTYSPDMFYSRMDKVGKSFAYFLSKYKQNKFISLLILKKYAPFQIIHSTCLFNKISYILSKSKLLKLFSQKQHWFWSIAYHYSKGLLLTRIKK